MPIPRHFLTDMARMRSSAKHSACVDLSAPARYEVRACAASLGPRHRKEEGRERWFGQFRRVGWPHWLTVTGSGNLVGKNKRFHSPEDALAGARLWLANRGLPEVIGGSK